MDDRISRPTVTQRLRTHPVLSGVALAVVTGVAVVVLVWFQPQALLFDTVVDEAFPTGDAEAAGGQDPADAPSVDAPEEVGAEGADDGEGGGSAADPADADPADMAEGQDATPASPAGPVVLGTGTFASRNRYTVTGEASVYELEDRSRILRLEDFESTNGPDLFVYLTAADSAGTDAELGADAIDLGVLTGNVGDQNYEIPDDVDLDRYDTVVIWCRRFAVGFGAADLASA